jgi:predicted dehydrogenase
MIRIAIIGYGYWGPNIVRNFATMPHVSISWIVDINPKTLINIPKLYPNIQTTSDIRDVLKDPHTQAVVIVSPAHTHFSLAHQVLKAGKHVLVEKPLTQTTRDASTLVRLAKKKKKILMVDHTFIYTPAIRKLKKIISSGQLGRIVYIDSVRTNLGLLQKDSNVIEDLAVHDFSIIDYFFGLLPETISATGLVQKEIKQESIAHITAMYPNNLFVHCHVSWLSPVKIRRMIIVGTKKMALYDDIEPSEKIKIYDKGISFIPDPKQSLQQRIGYRSGSVVVPHIDIQEGLFGMTKDFIHAIRTNRQPITDGAMGLRVVHLLVKSTVSLRHGGKPIRISMVQ